MSLDPTTAHKVAPPADTRIVSIVIPTFNRKDRLVRCLDKIRRNVRTPHETIVVDGGSTDGTREWLLGQPHVFLGCEKEDVERHAVSYHEGHEDHEEEALRGEFGDCRAGRARRSISEQALRIPGRRHPATPLSSRPSWSWLGEEFQLVLILEEQREGAVRAFNKGFKAATGHYVMWLNDDAYPLPGSVEAAVAMLERPDLPELGMVAFYHNWHNERNVLDRVEHDGASYELCHVRGYPYANFGLLRRELLAKVGYADERFYFFGFDPDLSLKIQIGEGLKVLGCRQALIHHDEHHDDRKLADLPRGQEDNAKLFAKWNLPPPGAYPDPVPGYRRLMIRYGLSSPPTSDSADPGAAEVIGRHA
jgi:GT2 family glycosyltransferase